MFVVFFFESTDLCFRGILLLSQRYLIVLLHVFLLRFIKTVAFLIKGKSILLRNSFSASLKFMPQLICATNVFSSMVSGPYIRFEACSKATCKGIPVLEAVAKSLRNSGVAFSIFNFPSIMNDTCDAWRGNAYSKGDYNHVI